VAVDAGEGGCPLCLSSRHFFWQQAAGSLVLTARSSAVTCVVHVLPLGSHSSLFLV
jgi:hypothetical protein